jgi:carbon-monoxide dehydrogenase medium subunit
MSAALVTYRLDGGKMADVHLGVGGAEPTPRRLAEVEGQLNGQPPSDALFRHAADIAAQVIEPLQDHQTSSDYRCDLVRAVVRRALEMSAR